MIIHKSPRKRFTTHTYIINPLTQLRCIQDWNPAEISKRFLFF